MRVTRPRGEEGERGEGVEKGWIPHGFRTFQWNKARWCQPTCVCWVQRTSKATTPLSTVAFTTFPSILPSRPTPPTYATLSRPFPSPWPLALSPISVPPNPLTTLPVDPICTYVAALARIHTLSMCPMYLVYIHLVHRPRYGIKMDATYASGHRARYGRTHTHTYTYVCKYIRIYTRVRTATTNRIHIRARLHTHTRNIIYIHTCIYATAI